MNRNLLAVIFFSGIMLFASVGTVGKLVSENIDVSSVNKILQPDSSDDSDHEDDEMDDDHGENDNEDHEADHNENREREDDND